MSTSVENLERDGDIDLRPLIARLWSRRRWIAASVIVSTSASIAVALFMTPIYRATTVLVSANSDRSGAVSLGTALGQLGGLASLAGINVGSGGAQTEESLAVLKSREFTEAFIRDEDLMPEFFSDRWDKKTKRWIVNADDQPTPAQAFKFFDDSVRTVSNDRKTGLIAVEIEWRDPAMSALWANRLVARLNGEMRARAIARTNAEINYLQRELASTTAVETREAISRLMEAQINQRMLANVTEEYAFRVVDRALAPDRKDVVRPKKLQLLVLGPVLGLMVGVFAVAMLGAFSIPRTGNA